MCRNKNIFIYEKTNCKYAFYDWHTTTHRVNIFVAPNDALEYDLEAMEDDLQDYGVYASVVDVVFDEEELDDSGDEEDEHAYENDENKYKNLTGKQRQDIYAALLERSNRGNLQRNTTSIVAELFNVKRTAVQGVWRRVKQCRAQGIPVDVSSRKPKNCGRKKIEIDLSQVASIPLHRRSTIRSLAEALGVKKSTLHRWFKEGLLRRHSNSLKPYLKEANKKSRLQFCVSMLDQHTLLNEPKFIDMHNIVHLDEKWFNTTKKARNFYMLPEEEDPHRTVQNKNSIDKVMFLSAVARPRYDDEGNCTFDGKIGMWPFIRKVGQPFYTPNFLRFVCLISLST